MNLEFPQVIHNLCAYYKFIEYGLFGTSILHLTAITINRYVLVCHQGFYSRIYCTRNVVIMISIMWIFGFGVGLFPLFGLWGQIGKLWSMVKHYCFEKVICSFDWNSYGYSKNRKSEILLLEYRSLEEMWWHMVITIKCQSRYCRICTSKILKEFLSEQGITLSSIHYLKKSWIGN